jgi:aspartate aminotransferase-like enzyme
LQLTAWTGSDLATKRAQWQAVFPAVAGVGQGAWSRGATKFATKSNVVLYVDYGSFGLEFAVTAPAATATVTMAVTLAQDIK